MLTAEDLRAIAEREQRIRTNRQEWQRAVDLAFAPIYAELERRVLADLLSVTGCAAQGVKP